MKNPCLNVSSSSLNSRKTKPRLHLCNSFIISETSVPSCGLNAVMIGQLLITLDKILSRHFQTELNPEQIIPAATRDYDPFLSHHLFCTFDAKKKNPQQTALCYKLS